MSVLVDGKAYCKDEQCPAENPQPLENFSYDRGYRKGSCRVCINRRAREWGKKNPEKRAATRRKWHESHPEYHLRAADLKLQRQFGVGLQYKQTLIDKQGGRCGNPGCAATVTIKDSLDHNHTTSALRGVLCDPCNLALGLLKENPDRIEGLVEYLSRFDVDDSKSA